MEGAPLLPRGRDLGSDDQQRENCAPASDEREGGSGIVRGLLNRASKVFRRGHYDVEGASKQHAVGAEYREVRGAHGNVLEEDWSESGEEDEEAKPKALDRIATFFGMDERSQQQLRQVNLYDYPDTESEDDSDDDSSIALWQHGTISPEEAERRLRDQGSHNGLFLVRRDRLMLCCDDRIHVYPITRTRSGVALRGMTVFRSLPALVTHYSLFAEQLPCLLGRPCPQVFTGTSISRMGSGRSAVATTALLAAAQPSYHSIESPSSPPAPGPASSAAMAAMAAHSSAGSMREPPPSYQAPSAALAAVPSLSLAPPPPPRASDFSPQQSSTLLPTPPPPNPNARAEQPATRPAGRKLTAEEREREKRIRRLRALPVFKPHFTWLISIIQIAVLLAAVIQGGLVKVAFSPSIDTRVVDLGFRNSTLSVPAPFNFYIGPNARFLVGFGAKYSPCMRKDTALAIAAATQRSQEDDQFRCCVGPGGKCGVTRSQDCTGLWEQQLLLCPADRCPSVVLRPCCVGVNGTCLIASQDHCAFLSGVWMSGAQRCGDTQCLPESCKFGLEPGSTPNQWYRLVTSIFIHAGIIHLFLVLLLQYFLGCQIERAIGSLRIALVYLTAGIAGNLTSAFFAPALPQVGATGAIHGLLAINIVDLFQSWSLVERPTVRLIKLIGEICVYFLLGFLPWVGNWSHLGGLVFGLLAAIVFVPHITFGAWHRVRRVCLVLVTLPLLIVSFFGLLLFFYNVQDTNFCGVFCEYMQCVPFTAAFCGDASLL